jgi:hypothetical protein
MALPNSPYSEMVLVPRHTRFVSPRFSWNTLTTQRSSKHCHKLILSRLLIRTRSPSITKGQKMKGHLAWANGDTTGFGLHADFLNGWDVDILSKALNDPGCVNLGYSIEIQKCPILAPYFNTGAAQSCKPSRGQLQEPYPQGDGNVVPKLPGCNPLWGASGPKPTCNPAVPGLDVSAFLSTADPFVVPASEMRNNSLSQDKGWRKVGCFTATSSAKPLGDGGISYMDSNMTPTRCQQACAKNGFTYSGLSVVGGFVCACSNTLDQNSAPVYSGCDTPCPTGSETCGGKGPVSCLDALLTFVYPI